MSASAFGSNGIANVQFQINGSNLGAAVTAAPYSQTLDTISLANGNHSLSAVVTDMAQHKASSASVSITVNNSSNNEPMVSITSPFAGIMVSGTIAVTASASDSNGIASVQFQVDGSNLGSPDTSSPYSQSWNTTTVADGPHTLTAVATSVSSTEQPGTASAVVIVNNSGTGLNLSSTPGWHKIPKTALCGGPENATFTAPDNFPANLGPYTSYGFSFKENCYQALEDSNGGVMDTARNRLIIWGGGHQHYWGNDLWSVELNNVGTSNPVMVHLNYSANPSAIVGNTSTVETLAACSYAPGCTPTTNSPGSRHTYGGIDYFPPTDEFVSIAGATSPFGNSSSHIWTLPMGNLLPSCAPSGTTVAGCDPRWTDHGSYSGIGTVGTVSDYDPNTQLIWGQTQNGLFAFNPINNVLTAKNTQSYGYHSSGVVDPEDQYFIMVGPTNGFPPEGLHYYKIGSGSTFTLQTPTVTPSSCASLITSGVTISSGPDAGSWPQYQGLAWDPVGHRVVIYPNGTNELVYLYPKTWACSTEAYGSTRGTDYPQDTVVCPSGAGSCTGANGTFGHFRYSPVADVFILCNDPSNDCWYLRPNPR